MTWTVHLALNPKRGVKSAFARTRATFLHMILLQASAGGMRPGPCTLRDINNLTSIH